LTAHPDARIVSRSMRTAGDVVSAEGSKCDRKMRLNHLSKNSGKRFTSKSLNEKCQASKRRENDSHAALKCGPYWTGKPRK